MLEYLKCFNSHLNLLGSVMVCVCLQTNLLNLKTSLLSMVHNASRRTANLNISKQNSRNVLLHCNANNIIQPLSVHISLSQ